MAAIKSLGCTDDKPNLSVSGFPYAVHVIYDVPHPLKSV